MAILAAASIVVDKSSSTVISEMSAQLQISKNEILTEVSTVYASNDSLTSKITQTSQEWKAELDDTVKGLNGEIEKRTKYMRYDGGLWLGDSTSPIQLLMENNKISFVVSGDRNNPPMWITANVINISELEVKKRFKIGPLTWTINANGIGVIR